MHGAWRDHKAQRVIVCSWQLEKREGRVFELARFTREGLPRRIVRQRSGVRGRFKVCKPETYGVRTGIGSHGVSDRGKVFFLAAPCQAGQECNCDGKYEPHSPASGKSGSRFT